MIPLVTITEAEYLRTSYEPDCEFDDGVLVERNVGEEPHSWLQTAIAVFFSEHRREWGITAYTELRFQIRAGKYMIPDVAVIRGPRSKERVLTQPPLIWIEILSLEDRPLKVNKRVRKLLAFGVPNIWVIDPDTLEADAYTPAGSKTIDDGILRVEDTDIVLSLHALVED